MSNTHTEQTDGREWFLRTGGEAVFGPVSTDGLVMWAEQGRILPGHEVSNDRKKWIPAVSVELLDMRWFVDDGEGDLRGPLNRQAAEALVKSGRVREGAQIVSADDVETPSESSGNGAAEKSRERIADADAQARIRELEAQVAEWRGRVGKRADNEELDTVRRERDELTERAKALAEQQETLLRNAEKDARMAERKQEQMRAQIRKLEQQLEETNSRLLQESDAVSAAAGASSAAETRVRDAEQARDEAMARAEALAKEADALRMRVGVLDRQIEEQCLAGDAREAEGAREREGLAARVTALEQAVKFHEKRDADLQQMLTQRDTELAAERLRAEACERRTEAADEAVKSAQARVRESEAAFADLLTDANTRDSAYAEKIAALEKACAQPPEETSRFYTDRAALYDLLKAEAEELGQTMEQERAAAEHLREWSVQRQQALLDRRQTLLRQLGGSPAEMTRRTVREQPSDPNAARLRTELDDLRLLHQREVHQREDRERDLLRKLRVLESESIKLRGQVAEGEKLGRQMQEFSETLRKREQELSDERRGREAEREQFQGSQQALLMRIEALEKSARPVTPDEVQSAEAKTVKLATWMRLRK